MYDALEDTDWMWRGFDNDSLEDTATTSYTIYDGFRQRCQVLGQIPPQTPDSRLSRCGQHRAVELLQLLAAREHPMAQNTKTRRRANALR